MLNIQVAGPGCSNCAKLEAKVKEALLRLGMEATVTKITDFRAIAAAGVLMTPGLIVNGKVVSQGKVPDDATLEKILREASGS
ncbi:MAG: thioredoxin family protein [Acidobacteriota bacterium]